MWAARVQQGPLASNNQVEIVILTGVYVLRSNASKTIDVAVRRPALCDVTCAVRTCL